jgi:glycerol-3-phosphate dehydrogenase
MPDVPSAVELARVMVDLGEGAGRRTVALITAMDSPLGRSVGNALEVQEALDVLGGGGDAELVCECELVTRPMLQAAVDAQPDASLDDLRRATRLGMGPCQGAFCTPRAAAMLGDREDSSRALLGFLHERFRGTRPIAWGDQLAELWLEAGIYRGSLAVETLEVPDADV